MAVNLGHREKKMTGKLKQLRCGFSEDCLESAGQIEELMKVYCMNWQQQESFPTVYSRKLRYAGHAMRNQKTDLMKTVFQGKIEAKRKRGRPAASLVGNITGACNMKIHEIGRACQDRDRWRRITLSASFNAAANIARGDADR